MKKIKMIAVAILAGLMCIACTPKKEKLLCAYEEACQKGDAIAAMKVISEIEKEFGSNRCNRFYLFRNRPYSL